MKGNLHKARVKDLIKCLADYNPNAKVVVNINGHPKPIVDIAWHEDGTFPTLNTAESKLNAVYVSLFIEEEQQ